MKNILNIKAKVTPVNPNSILYKTTSDLKGTDCVIMQFVGDGTTAVIAYREGEYIRTNTVSISDLTITDSVLDL